MGHGDLKTTEIYLHVVETMTGRFISPLDRLDEFVQEESQVDPVACRAAP